ncbi:hypothetical protein KSC_014750 [Ktedonobacter sp. SOSP1-52]|nr:hypothetical protein KSC_014750 [Ktedonobacter sp. SOSP1-52]
MDPYHTKVITGTTHEAPHLIDGLLYHETELNIQGHYVDTGGVGLYYLSILLSYRSVPYLVIDPVLWASYTRHALWEELFIPLKLIPYGLCIPAHSFGVQKIRCGRHHLDI